MPPHYRQRLISGLVLLLAFAVAALVQYYLANKPVAVDVYVQKTSPALAKVNQQEIVIENPVDDANRVVFLINGQINEIVDLHFDKARLSQPTLERFQHLPKPAPAGLETVDFIAQDVRRILEEQASRHGRSFPISAGGEKGECRTFVKVEVAPGANFPSSQRFHQTHSSDLIKDFYVTTNSDLLVSLMTSPRREEEASGDRWAPGCGRLLRIGDKWSKHNAGYWDLAIFVPADATIHFTVRPDQDNPLWKTPQEFVQLFEFGSIPLKASGITLQTHQSSQPTQGDPPALKVNASDEHLVRVNSLKLNNEAIQVDFSGNAWVHTDGKATTRNVLENLGKYPFYNGLFGILLTALFGWFVYSFKGLFRRPEEEYVKPDDD